MIKLFSFAILILLVTSCASTSLTNEWRDPAYHDSGMRSLLVVGLPANSPLGLQCCDEFVRQLEERGIKAVSGMGTAAVASKEAGIATAREMGAEGVLVCRFLERKTELDVYPRETETLMFGPDVELWSPVQYQENPYDVFGTSVYAPRTGKVIWTGISDTYAGASDKKIMKSYVKAVLRRLEEEGLVQRSK